MRPPDYERLGDTWRWTELPHLIDPAHAPNVISVTSGRDANDKGNRRAKVVPGLSAGFHCSPRNLSAGSQCRCPYMGSRFWAAGASTGRAAGWAADRQLG